MWNTEIHKMGKTTETVDDRQNTGNCKATCLETPKNNAVSPIYFSLHFSYIFVLLFKIISFKTIKD